MTLADLACTLLSILFAALVWLRGKKDGGEDADNENEQAERMDKEAEEDEPRGHAVPKTVNAVLAVLSVVLFFLTQPLVWRFRLDWWTVLFVLLCGTALAMLIWKRKENKQKKLMKKKRRILQGVENDRIHWQLVGLMSHSRSFPRWRHGNGKHIHPRRLRHFGKHSTG